ncbi:hypothetical protein [Aequorivita capsosiphonis]|nr:hypothetical protein [Aequorivita capsosiphonis]
MLKKDVILRGKWKREENQIENQIENEIENDPDSYREKMAR